MTLREYRTARGLTQEALAEILGVTKQMVSRWETGVSNPGSNALVNLATTLNVVISIKPATREISFIPAEDFQDPYAGLNQEQIDDRLTDMGWRMLSDKQTKTKCGIEARNKRPS